MLFVVKKIKLFSTLEPAKNWCRLQRGSQNKKKTWVLAHAIRLKGHLKLKNRVLLEQVLSHLTHTMESISWIDIYIMFSVCGLKLSLSSSMCIDCFFTVCKNYEENTGPLQKWKLYHDHFTDKLPSQIQTWWLVKCCREGQLHLKMKSCCPESRFTDLNYLSVLSPFQMKTWKSYCPVFRRIIWNTEK